MTFAGITRGHGMRRLLAIFFALLATPAIAQLTPTNAAVHAELSAVKDRMIAAVNRKDGPALIAELDPTIHFTAMNNETFIGIEGAKAYYQKMLVGSSRIVQDMSLTAKPDDYSLLYVDDRAAISTGSSVAHFKISNGPEFDVPLRWTATLVNREGKWKAAAVHFSANMFDNPIMNAVGRYTWWVAGGVGLVGLLLGWLIGRRKRA